MFFSENMSLCQCKLFRIQSNRYANRYAPSPPLPLLFALLVWSVWWSCCHFKWNKHVHDDVINLIDFTWFSVTSCFICVLVSGGHDWCSVISSPLSCKCLLGERCEKDVLYQAECQKILYENSSLCEGISAPWRAVHSKKCCPLSGLVPTGGEKTANGCFYCLPYLLS